MATLPTISTPIWGIDASTPLASGGPWFENSGGISNGGPPAITAYPGAVQSVQDLVTQVDWWDLLGPAPLQANIQNSLPGWNLSTYQPYSFAGSEDVDNVIYTIQGAPGGVPSSPAPFTTFVVCSFTTTPGTAVQRLWSITDWPDTATWVNGTSVWATSSGFYFSRGSSTYTATTHVATTPVSDTVYVVVATYSGGKTGTLTLTVNSLTAATTTATDMSDPSTVSWAIGNYGAAGYNGGAQDPLIGYLFEGRTWGSAASATEISALITYGTSKWVGATSYNLSLSETATTATAFAATGHAAITIAETAATSDTCAATASPMAATIVETATTADTYAAAATAALQVSETATTADAVAATGHAAAAVAETAGTSDTYAATATVALQIAETATAADAIAAIGHAAGAIAEAVTTADALSTAPPPLALAEAVTAADMITAASTVPLAVTETATASDTLAATRIAALAVTETATIGDALAATSAATAVIAEAVTASDQATASANTPLAIAETTTASDALAITPHLNQAISESAAAADTIVSTATIAPISIAETTTTSDAYLALAAGNYAASLADNVTATDLIASTATIAPIQVTETVTTADTLVLSGVLVGVAETATAADSFTLFPPVNILPNSAGAGAVSGLLPTPGALPDGWALQSNPGLSVEVIAAAAGYTDIRFFGTSTGGDLNVTFASGPYPIALPSWTYTQSNNLAMISGSMANVAAIVQAVDNLDINNNYLGSANYQVDTLTGTLTNFSGTFVTASDTARLNSHLAVAGTTAGGAVDITIRVQDPQILQAVAIASAALSDTVTATDSIQIQPGFSIQISEGVAAHDALSSTATIAPIQITETVTTQDTVTALSSGNYAASIFELVAASDIIVPAALLPTTLHESVAASDTLVAAATQTATIQESVATTDHLAATGVFNLSISEGVAATDTLVPNLTVALTLAEDVAVTDTLFPILSLYAAIGARTRRPRPGVSVGQIPAMFAAIAGRTRTPHGAGRALFCAMSNVQSVTIAPDIRTVQIPKDT